MPAGARDNSHKGIMHALTARQLVIQGACRLQQAQGELPITRPAVCLLPENAIISTEL